MAGSHEILIRPATLADAESLSREISRLSREFITPDYTPEWAATLLSRLTPEVFGEAIEGEVAYWVAEIDQQFVGAVGIFPVKRHLYHLFVAAEHHRRGIGRQLWDAARDAASTGPITVNSSRFAIRFYERLGFASTGPSWEKNGVIAYPMQWDPLPEG